MLGVGYRILARKELVNPPSVDCGEAAHNGFCEGSRGNSGASQVVKNPPVNAGDPGLIHGSKGSHGKGNGNLLQYSCLENPVDREAWWATVQGSQKVGHNCSYVVHTHTHTHTHTLPRF